MKQRAILLIFTVHLNNRTPASFNLRTRIWCVGDQWPKCIITELNMLKNSKWMARPFIVRYTHNYTQTEIQKPHLDFNGSMEWQQIECLNIEMSILFIYKYLPLVLCLVHVQSYIIEILTLCGQQSFETDSHTMLMWLRFCHKYSEINGRIRND